ncbi:MAG: ATP-binding protein [Acetivibrio sp.]
MKKKTMVKKHNFIGIWVGILLICALQSGIKFKEAYSAIIKQTEDALAYSNLEYSSMTREWLNGFGNLLDSLAVETGERALYTNREEMEDYLNKRLEPFSDVLSVYMSTIENVMIDSTKWRPDASFIAQEREWYIKGKNSDKIVYVDPYVDAQTGKKVLSISKKIVTNGKFQGVMAMDIVTNVLSDFIRKSVTQDGQYAFLTDQRGNILIHPDKILTAKNGESVALESLSENYKNIARAVRTGDTGTSIRIKNYKGQEAFMTLAIIPETEWRIVSSYPARYEKQAIVREMFSTITALIASISALFFLEICGTAIQASMADKMEKTIQELQLAKKSKDDFLANMSHEIRTPMNAVCGMSELILREEGISQTVRENSFNIQIAGRSLLGIINNILDFSKIESGKMELIEDTYNIASILNDILNLSMIRKGEKKLEIIADCDPNIPIGLIGDETKIRQVILNLMTNAVKYTEQGMVVLEVSAREETYGVNLRISIKDTGIGMTKQSMEKLFGSFSQLDTKKNRAIEGTGLGLAISKRLVSLMGGFIQVVSTYGEGSEFIVTIPQKVSDKKHFVSIKDIDKIKIAVYIHEDKFKMDCINKKYSQLFLNISEPLHINCRRMKTLWELKENLNNGSYTHVFIGKEEYLEDNDYFAELSKEVMVVVAQDREGEIKVPNTLRQVYKPFYILSVANILNGESILDILGKANDYSGERFKAPTAKILIVDDNEMNLKVAMGLMKIYDMQIFTAISGEESIHKLQQKDFDLVFMDHMMPGMDGVEAVDIIRKMDGEYYQKIPIIALTANAVNGVREMFIEHGFQDFVAKPIETSALERTLLKWLPKEKIGKRSSNFVSTTIQEQEIWKNHHFQCMDEKTGLHYSGENMQQYENFLTIFLNSSKKSKYELEDTYNQKDWKNYAIHIHALKSTSLVIGAVKLSDIAKALEEAAKNGNDTFVRENHDKAMEEYQNVLKEIQEAFPKDSVCPVTSFIELTEDQLKEGLLKVKQAAENFDQEEVKKELSALEKFTFKEEKMEEILLPAKEGNLDFAFDIVMEEMDALYKKFFG